jgi:hypothetical protein
MELMGLWIVLLGNACVEVELVQKTHKNKTGLPLEVKVDTVVMKRWPPIFSFTTSEPSIANNRARGTKDRSKIVFVVAWFSLTNEIASGPPRPSIAI